MLKLYYLLEEEPTITIVSLYNDDEDENEDDEYSVEFISKPYEKIKEYSLIKECINNKNLLVLSIIYYYYRENKSFIFKLIADFLEKSCKETIEIVDLIHELEIIDIGNHIFKSSIRYLYSKVIEHYLKNNLENLFFEHLTKLKESLEKDKLFLSKEILSKYELHVQHSTFEDPYEIWKEYKKLCGDEKALQLGWEHDLTSNLLFDRDKNVDLLTLRNYLDLKCELEKTVKINVVKNYFYYFIRNFIFQTKFDVKLIIPYIEFIFKHLNLDKWLVTVPTTLLDDIVYKDSKLIKKELREDLLPSLCLCKKNSENSEKCSEIPSCEVRINDVAYRIESGGDCDLFYYINFSKIPKKRLKNI